MDVKNYARTDPSNHDAGRTILFFDGVCGLCNALVDFLIARDQAQRLRYSPLQGEAFAALARERPELADIDSVIVSHEDAVGATKQIYIRSRAALFVLGQLGGGWRLMSKVLLIAPQPVSDLVYRFIARVRYWIFGKKAACRLPTAAERGLFLP